MGDAAGAEAKKALRIAAMDGDGASTRASVAPAEQQRPAPLLSAAAGSVSVQRCGDDDDDDDDEKVERFYALLANIRALRGLCNAGESGSAGGRGRKRAREAEAPWRPAFRMEDFEEEVSQSQITAEARCAVKNRGTSGAGVVARRPAAARARAAAADHEEDEHGEKLGRRVAAQV
ncbi:hypothetical protein C2845_PM05G23320 [Panicum miliaceum]|uniref:Uncharacterized protein n=1 Tax=Panicum miliaceum TaxID=4540 RepID=A0A3L6SXR0_PANMI|nr:hypothetical protein C2845_PM05G23320 [Panicum miliaceum]